MKKSHSPKTSRRAAQARERMKQALELRKAGATYDQIAQRLGYAASGAAYTAVATAIKDITRAPAEELRTLELERLDALMLAVWNKAKAGDYKAVDTVLRIMDRRAKYLGLDAPVRVAASTELSVKDVTIKWMDDWRQMLGANARFDTSALQ